MKSRCFRSSEAAGSAARGGFDWRPPSVGVPRCCERFDLGQFVSGVEHVNEPCLVWEGLVGQRDIHRWLRFRLDAGEGHGEDQRGGPADEGRAVDEVDRDAESQALDLTGDADKGGQQVEACEEQNAGADDDGESDVLVRGGVLCQGQRQDQYVEERGVWPAGT